MILPACSGDLEPGADGNVGGGNNGDNGNNAGCFTAADCAFGERCNAGVCEALPNDDPGPGNGGNGGNGSPAPSPDPKPPLPEEDLSELPIAEPVTGARFVYVVNTQRGSVARIDPEVLRVRALEVGSAPSQAQVAEGTDLLVILDRDSESLTILDAGAERSVLRRVPLGEPYDTLTLSPDGHFAVTWSSAAQDPALSHGRIAIVDLRATLAAAPSDLEALRAAREDRSVGLRVTHLSIPEGGGPGVIVSRRAVHLLPLDDLDAHPILPTVTLELPSSRDIAHRRVLHPPGGEWLFVHHPQHPIVEVVDLDALTRAELDLGAASTAVQLDADGRRLVAVIRRRSDISPDIRPKPDEQPGATPPPSPTPMPSPITPLGGEVVIAPVPDALDDPDAIRRVSTDALVVGQVALAPASAAANRHIAVLFTNAVHREELTLLDLRTGALTPLPGLLIQAVDTVSFTPDGRNLLVLQRPSRNARELDPVEQAIDMRWGYTIVNLATQIAIPQILDGPPQSVAFAEGGAFAAVLLDEASGNAAALQLLNLRQLLFAGEIRLASPPRFAGFLPGSNTAFVAQAHAAGRMTFVDLAALDVRTVTGFDANGEIRR